MTMKTGLLALGLFTIGGALTVSCGGSSDDGGGPNGTAGSTSSSGSGTGGSTTAGTSATGGTSTGGTSTGGTSAAGTSTGGTSTGGTGNAGGEGPGFPGGGEGPDFPGFGGEGNTPMCPAAQPMDGDACTLQGFLDCDYGDVTCNCRRTGGQGQDTRAWDCGEGGPGAGGAGPGFGDAVCPENAEDDDACTGTGVCEGQSCFCFEDTVNCF